MVHILRISQSSHNFIIFLASPAPPLMDNIITSSPTATYSPTAAYVTASASLHDGPLGTWDGVTFMMSYVQVTILFLVFGGCGLYLVALLLNCLGCTKLGKPKKMQYYSKVTAQKWYAEFDVNKPWKARYKINERFTFEPLFDPDEDKEVIAINGWTNTKKGNAYFVTQDLEIYLSEVQRLKKQEIPIRSTIDAYWDGAYSNPYLTETDLNTDMALEDAWKDINCRLGCMCSKELSALFYVIQVMPTWCDAQQYEAMKDIVGMKEKGSV